MTYKIRNFLPSLAVLGLVGASTFAVPSIAMAADNLTTQDKANIQKPIDKADNRVKQLHDKLGITPGEEKEWGKLAEVMHDNGTQMSEAIEKREKAEKTISAVDDLKAYQAIAQAHADGLKALVPAFEALYDVLSDSQKKEADALFVRGDKKMEHKS